ncbi:ATP-binding cassette domain-containing protein [Pseudonocardia sp. KRD291]|uniref:ATP-binding cassette domain-containing protein n=1 Tax=Pseudonocardia sp. KRD291 TaxID=2792007 RepID=UPI001C49EA22|nr:ATP-binding cassette domain-containing protein [Pseudonocardia sp. KRD291]MBW0101908.1 hypothetical protein [Pseudonocardia sp. KRD291]
MILTADGVAVDGPHGPLLETTTFGVGSGEIALVSGAPGAGHTALALALAGRMRPSRGRVRLDGADDPALLRRRVAVVDTPGISEPEPVLPLRAVVGEELAMAGRGTLPHSVVAWLDARGAAGLARTRFEDVPAPTRLALMLELAAMRPGVGVLVLTLPDRHGGSPQQWWPLVAEHAAGGRAVVVTCAQSSAELIGTPTARLGEDGDTDDGGTEGLSR